MKKLLLNVVIAAISWSAEASPLGLIQVQLDVKSYASRPAAASTALTDLKRPSPAVAILGWSNDRHNFCRPHLQALS